MKAKNVSSMPANIIDLKVLRALKPGAMLLLGWLDGEPTKAVLLERVNQRQVKGDISIRVLNASGGISSESHVQIIEVLKESVF